MSAGIRNERVRLFTYASGATAGRINPSYAYAAERWGRVSTQRADATTVATQAQHVATIIVALADEAIVQRNGVLKWDGRYWKVDAVEPRRAQREIQVTAFWVDESTITVTGEPA